MRFLTIVLVTLSFVFACKDKTTSPLRKRKANKFLLGNKKADSLILHLVKSYDPYNKGYTYLVDSSNYQNLTLYADGLFEEQVPEYKNRGNWYLNKEKKKLALIYAYRNGFEITQTLDPVSFRYQVDTIRMDTLILSVQGRHGRVKYYYVKPQPNKTSPDSVGIDTSFVSFSLLDSVLTDSVQVDSLEVDTVEKKELEKKF